MSRTERACLLLGTIERRLSAAVPIPYPSALGLGSRRGSLPGCRTTHGYTTKNTTDDITQLLPLTALD